jgi:hypothetical protein
MNKLHVVGLLTALSLLPITNSHARRVVDEIVARVNGVNILRSDLRIPRITKDGSPFTLDEAINEELFYQIACKRNILPKEADIDRQIVAFKMHHNLVSLSDEAFDKELREGTGISLKEYRLQLGRWFAVDNIKRVEINEKIVVTAQEVEEYYAKNPEYSQERFKLAVATINPNKDEAITDGLVWDNLGWIEKDNLKASFQIVESLKPGEVSEPMRSDDGKTLQRLKLLKHEPSALKTLDERYSAIEKILQDERKIVASDSLEKDIRAKAVIVHIAQEHEHEAEKITEESEVIEQADNEAITDHVDHEELTQHQELLGELIDNPQADDQETEEVEDVTTDEAIDTDCQALTDQMHELGSAIDQAHEATEQEEDASDI